MAAVRERPLPATPDRPRELVRLVTAGSNSEAALSTVDVGAGGLPAPREYQAGFAELHRYDQISHGCAGRS